MSLLAIAASAALAATTAPVHTVDMQHRNGTYRIDYRPHVETRLRTVGMEAGTRPTTQKCMVSATVTVERAISAQQSGQELKSMLPATKSFTEQLPGDCRTHSGEGDKLLARNETAVRTLLGEVADQDRQAAMAAIDSAHHLAAN